MSILKLSQLAIPFLTMMFAGSLGTEVLAGVGLANTAYNIVVYALKMGYRFYIYIWQQADSVCSSSNINTIYAPSSL